MFRKITVNRKKSELDSVASSDLNDCQLLSEPESEDRELLPSAASQDAKNRSRKGIFSNRKYLFIGSAIAGVLVLGIAGFYLFSYLQSDETDQAAEYSVQALVNADAKKWCQVVEPKVLKQVEESTKIIAEFEQDGKGTKKLTCQDYARNVLNTLRYNKLPRAKLDQVSYILKQKTGNKAKIQVTIEQKNRKDLQFTIELVKINNTWYLSSKSALQGIIFT